MNNSKEGYVESKISDKIAAVVFFILIFGCIFVSVLFERAFIIMVPFIIYGLWAVFSKRIWVPVFDSDVKPEKLFYYGKEAVKVGIWFIFVGGIFLILLLILFPYEEDPGNYCYSLEDVMQKDKCLYEVANSTGIMQYCLDINNEPMRQDCQYEQFLVYVSEQK